MGSPENTLGRENNMSEENDKKQWSYKSWYADNRVGLSEKRREKYQNDPEYKQKVLAQNRSYREKKAAEQSASPRSRIRTTKHRKPVALEVEINGETTLKQLFHVGSFARSIQRSVPTIHQWERLGIIPRTPFVLIGKTKQERLYTMEMIQAVKNALDVRNGQVSVTDKSFYTAVATEWESAGVSLKEKDHE